MSTSVHLNLNIESTNFATNQFGEKYLYALHRNTFKNISSSILFQQTYVQKLSAEDTLYIIIGTDSGLLLNYLLQSPLAKGSMFIFIEFPEIINLCCLNSQTSINPQIELSSYDNWQKIAEKHNLTEYLFIDRTCIIESFAVKDGFVSQYKLLENMVKHELSQLKWKSLTNKGQRVFIQAQLDNLAENVYPVYRLKNKFEKKKAILLAGGPSLDDYIDWVEKNRENYLVIAVSRIARRLLKTTIKPDFFVSIDPNDISFDVSKELLLFSKTSILIHHYHVSPLLLSQWQGLNFYIGSCFPWNTKNNPLNLSTSGPTVTNTAINFANFIGIKEIILMGVDLCYSSTGYTHASDSIEHLVGPMSSEIGQLVATNSGQLAETENSLFNAITSLSKQAKSALSNNCRIINPSPHAAKVEHVKYIPIEKINIEQASKAVSSISITTILAEIIPKHIIQDKREHILNCINEVQEIELSIEQTITIINNCLKYNSLFFKGNQPEKNFKYKLKLDELEDKLDKSSNQIAHVCKNFGTYNFLSFIKPTPDKEMSNKELELWGESYYLAYQKSAKDLLKQMKKVLTRLEFRLEELSSIKDIKALTDFLSQERSYARAYIIRDNILTAGKKLSVEEDAIITKLIEQYKKVVNSLPETTKQYKGISARADLKGCEIKAYEMFVRNDVTGLNRLISSLSEHKDSDAVAFLRYAQGLLFQLEGKESEAIEAYSKADNAHVNEHALKQISLIALEKMELSLAEQSLQLLSQFSIHYLPNLANLYKIQKKYKDAVDTYTTYLEVFPEDIIQLFNLAEIYQNTNNRKGARFIYEHILTIEPENLMAKQFLNGLNHE